MEKLGIKIFCLLCILIIHIIFSLLQLNDYKNAQSEAAKNHLKIWEYGDITEDDAKEFGLGP